VDNLSKIIDQKIEKESDLKSKDEKCPDCGAALWKTYKIFGSDRTVRVKCPCEMTEYRKRHELDEAKEKQARIDALIRNSLMDSTFRQKTFEKWQYNKGSAAMYQLGIRYAENFKECKEKGLGLLIHGEPGNGKTYLAASIANALLKKNVPTVCVSINSLLSRIQQTYNKWGKEAEQDVIKGLCNADLLIIDDLGTEKGSDWSKSTIYNIIDSRYRSNLPLVITTNLRIDPQETNGILTEKYEKRTEDRILEKCTPILNSSKSIRLDEAKRNTDLLKKILY
jgi:DNA replication protein DnaC